jgi:hypothetical protein
MEGGAPSAKAFPSRVAAMGPAFRILTSESSSVHKPARPCDLRNLRMLSLHFRQDRQDLRGSLRRNALEGAHPPILFILSIPSILSNDSLGISASSASHSWGAELFLGAVGEWTDSSGAVEWRASAGRWLLRGGRFPHFASQAVLLEKRDLRSKDATSASRTPFRFEGNLDP